MVTKEIIEAVVREVLNRILGRPLLVMVFTTYGENKVDISSLSSLLNEISCSYRVSALFHGKNCGRFVGNILREFGVDIIKDTEKGAIRETLNEAEVVLIPTLSLDTLARLCLGLIDNPVARIIYEALYEGKKVVVCTDTISAKPRTPEGLRRLIGEYLTRVRELGCIVTPLHQVKEALFDKEEDENIRTVSTSAPLSSVEISLKDKVLTAEGLTRLPRGVKRLILPDGALVTPLAWDQLKTSGIEVVFSKERGV